MNLGNVDGNTNKEVPINIAGTEFFTKLQVRQVNKNKSLFYYTYFYTRYFVTILLIYFKDTRSVTATKFLQTVFIIKIVQ